MRSAAYIDVDADLYISSFQALDWMFEQGLVEAETSPEEDMWSPR